MNFITELKSKNAGENKVNEISKSPEHSKPSGECLKGDDHKIISNEEVMTGRVLLSIYNIIIKFTKVSIIFRFKHHYT